MTPLAPTLENFRQEVDGLDGGFCRPEKGVAVAFKRALKKK